MLVEIYIENEWIKPKYNTNIPIGIFVLYFVVQLGLPLRHWAIKDDVLWTEEGHRMSWRMMLRSKKGVLKIYTLNQETGEKSRYDYKKMLSSKQKRSVATKPDLMWQLAQKIKEQEKEMAFLSSALLIAVFLILLILVTQFNSFSIPFIILFSVILSLSGVFLGIVIARNDFVIIMTMIGIISLAGIVVNNAIVLVDYTNLLRKRKRKELNLIETDQLSTEHVKNAIILGGKRRLRPVLLTAITTILGLLPLATGLNINFITLFTRFDAQLFFGGDNVIFFGPMSLAIIYGLTFATFLTLVVVPVMYFLIYKFKLWFYKFFKLTLRSNI